MADSKITALPEMTSPTSEDLLNVVNDPSGTPSNQKLTLASLFGGIPLDHINIQTKTPASASDTGTAGDIAWDADYLYVCTATDTWKRVGVATW